ncbi:hypothetical protein [Antarcticimicrobium sediminis]|uniref:hypothetical protein n=1 Tax=Antarcticimicrobium sediminis TaxID=2546227 RepID=UPI001FE03A7F|nr:hypothetical protein [Antarcticimicrobium sediminis]
MQDLVKGICATLGDMRCLCLIFCLVLIGCNTPSPHFRGQAATRIAVNDSVFDVRLRWHLAEAIRVNPQYAPRFGPIRDRAGLAMALVSGCSVTKVLGDQALATGRIACPDRKAPIERLNTGCQLLPGAAAKAGYPVFRCRIASSAVRRAE